MTQRTFIHNEDRKAEASVAGGMPSGLRSGPAARETVIVQFPFQSPVAAASMALEDAIETEEDSFQSLGSIAIKLVGAWSLPKLVCWRQGEEEPAASRRQLPEEGDGC